MNHQNLIFREALIEDYDDYYSIRAEKKNLLWTGYSNAPDYENFKNWFANRVNDPEKMLFVLYNENTILGSLHFDIYTDHGFIGYSIKEKFEGQGLATFLVAKAVLLGANNTAIKEIRAWINEFNMGSQKVISKNGFTESDNSEIRSRFGKDEKYLLFRRTV